MSSDSRADVVLDEEVPGLDLVRLRAFMCDRHLVNMSSPIRARVIAGGKSNLTYDVTDGYASWIVRRPPLSHVLPTAHDMSREYRVMDALASSDVPVPAMIAFCEDPDVIGAPFYIMEKVDGVPYRHADDLAPLGISRTKKISCRMVDVLVNLHRVDPFAVGLEDFGRPRNFLIRQVHRWRKQLDASRTRELDGIDALYEELEKHVPAKSEVTIVHGDFRLDNLLVNSKDEVAAVVDWEMATIGDPLTDLGLLLMYQRMGEMGLGAISDVSGAPGFISDLEISERYVSGSSRDLRNLGFYLGLAYFKFAVILEGIHCRNLEGANVGSQFDTSRDVVESLAKAGIAFLHD